MTIGMIDAVAGSGKTTAIVQTAIERAIQEKRPVNISLPTKEVIEEKYQDALRIADGRINVRRVHGDVPGCENVSAGLDTLLKSIGTHRPALLFTTHKTFNDCTNWIGRKDWTFYVDELFDPVQCVSLKLPRNYAVITDILELVTPSEMFSEVRVAGKMRKALEQMRDGLDDVDRVVGAVTSCLALPDRWKVYVECENYRTVLSGVGRTSLVDEREKAAELRFLLVQQPWFEREGLDVTMASACFTDRLLYKLWIKDGNEFVLDDAVMSTLQMHSHNGTGIELHCMNIRHWSTWVKNGGRSSNASDTPQRELERLIRAQFGDDHFIFCANSGWKGTLGRHAKQISVVQHGKNEHSHYSNVAFMPSLLPVPAKWRFLNWLGFTDDDIRGEYYHSNVYQSMFRSAARQIDRQERVRAILPDRAACEYVQSKAPGSEIIEHEVLAPRRGRGRPRKFADAAEVKAANAARMRRKRAQSEGSAGV
ncbi:hypothetical protein [Reyranella massiliensis]|uniref:hypothetical protein n=1 Tax=Reyranella massiliensis TaxID=445220 RepID=UPI00030C5FDB|nr:hypothetical protein [Reyranella massiliensis]